MMKPTMSKRARAVYASGWRSRLAGRQRRELAELVERIMLLCCARVLGRVGNRCDQAFRPRQDG
jgi:hypothetical protein